DLFQFRIQPARPARTKPYIPNPPASIIHRHIRTACNSGGSNVRHGSERQDASGSSEGCEVGFGAYFVLLNVLTAQNTQLKRLF
ncbi:MAG: hypothetical protein FWC34_00040, partial [Bacteroidetes bacterium]|nr:hypothetical protein [Bacteroidota bacterium]